MKEYCEAGKNKTSTDALSNIIKQNVTENFMLVILNYGTAQTQVDGLAQVLELALEYSRTNTCIVKVSAQHRHNTTAHVMSLNK